MRASTLRALIDGKFICPIAFPIEYEDLAETQCQDQVQDWLEKIGMRLARVKDEGAFFMAPEQVAPSDVVKVRDELRAYRDIYGPAILALDMIRQADPDGISLQVGEYLQAGALETSINGNPALEAQLNALAGTVKRFVLRNTVRDRVDAVLEHMAGEGYLIVKDKSRGSYRVTGKIEQLWAVLEFIEEHERIREQEGTAGQSERLFEESDVVAPEAKGVDDQDNS